MSQTRERALKGIKAGDTFQVVRTFSEAETLEFGDMIRDYNPVHYDNRFSACKGFTDRILHGLLTASMICEIGGQLAWLASSMDFAFKKPVYFGDTITCTLTIQSVNEKGFARAEAVFTNQRNDVVITSNLSGFVPRQREQAVLSKMLAEGDPTNKLA